MGFSLGNIVKSIGLSAIPIIGPMLAIQNLTKPETPSQPTTPPQTPDMFGQSQFSQYTAPPMAMPPPQSFGSGLPPTDPTLQLQDQLQTPTTTPPQATEPPQLTPEQLQLLQNIRA